MATTKLIHLIAEHDWTLDEVKDFLAPGMDCKRLHDLEHDAENFAGHLSGRDEEGA